MRHRCKESQSLLSKIKQETEVMKNPLDKNTVTNSYSHGLHDRSCEDSQDLFDPRGAAPSMMETGAAASIQSIIMLVQYD